MTQTFRRILSLTLALVLTITFFVPACIPSVNAAEPTAGSSVSRVRIDKETKGNWEGNYGKDTAILFGYTWSGDRTQTSFYIDNNYNANDLDLVVAGSGGSTLTSHSYYIGGDLTCYSAEQTDAAVLNMPKSSTEAKFRAYAGGGGPGSISDNSTTYSANFTIELNGTEERLLSLYGDQTHTKDSNGNTTPFQIRIVDKTTGTELFKETLAADTFTGGAYVTYKIAGSVVVYLDKESMDFGLTGCFIDPVSEEAAANTALRVGRDTTTKGSWEGVYGRDTAVLYGYGYTGEIQSSFHIDANTYDLCHAGSSGSSLTTHTYYIGGQLWCYAANESDASVLNLPAGVSGQRFCAYTHSGGSSTEHKGYFCATFDFKMADKKLHQFSIYGNKGLQGTAYLTFQDEKGNVLLKDTLEAGTFANGEYVTYLIPGSFKLTMDKAAMDDGFMGVFIDPVAENPTKDLTATAGTTARSVVLNWAESAGISSGTKILIERAKNGGDWSQIAELDAGVKTYLDKNLEAGATYAYRLRSVCGTAYTWYGAAAQCAVSAYSSTELTFAQSGYTAKSCDETVTVKLQLKTATGSVCVGQSVSLSVDFGHDTQAVETQATDADGYATFPFKPKYMGEATLRAAFADNDEENLMNTTATATLYVGETDWTSAPVIWNISDGVKPGELISLNGYGLKNSEDMSKLVVKCAPHTGEAPKLPPEDAATLEIIQTDSRDGYYLVVKFGEDLTAGAYDVWASNGYGWSSPVLLNTPRPLFISEYQAWCGQAMTISGRNFAASLFGAKTDTKVRLSSGSTAYEQSITYLSPYSMKFTVGTVPTGEYSVEVSNDGGKTWTALECAQTLEIVSSGSDPLGLGYAWMDHFAWESRYDVTDYGADNTDTLDDTAAILAAISEAKATEAGGVIYFPDGDYYISGLEIPANIVLLGESTDGTRLIYNGDGKNMFQSSDDGETNGHQGFARFSVRLADDAIRPDTFFWLGHEWDNNIVGDLNNRTACEIFLYGIDLQYSKTKDAGVNRGLGTVIIAKERFTVQKCNFSGWAASIQHAYVNDYVGYYDNTLNFAQGCLQSTANYFFVEGCSVYGNLDASRENAANSEDTHGVFSRAYAHMEGNHVENVGSFPNIYDGESYCLEATESAFNYGSVIRASENTVSFIPKTGELKEYYALRYGRLAVWITDGRGMGQLRDVASIDPETRTITIRGTWDVVPDATSKLTLCCPLTGSTIYNNTQKNTGKGIYVYGYAHDAVVANNTGTDSEGILVWTAHVAGDCEKPSAYVSVRENSMTGISPGTNDVKISVISQRQIRGGNYYAVSAYGISIKNNLLEGVRGSVSTGKTEAPAASGIVSWSAVKSGETNKDGYCGDNTNLVIENNILKNFDTAITTTLGDYGVVVYGNRFADVGQRVGNTNTSAENTGNYYEYGSDAYDESETADKGLLKEAVAAAGSIDLSKYSDGEEKAAFVAALADARIVLADLNASDSALSAALNELNRAKAALMAENETDTPEPDPDPNPNPSPIYLPTILPAQTWTNPYTDVSVSDSFYDAVKFVTEEGLMNGVSKNQFAPYRSLTRGMLVTILYRMEGEPTVTADAPFTDLTQDWYRAAVIWAAQNGIVNGVGHGKFAPEQALTNEQLMVILHRYAGGKGYQNGQSKDLTAFEDAGNVSGWATEAMKWAAAMNFLSGKQLNATTDAIRADIAQTLMLFCKAYRK